MQQNDDNIRLRPISSPPPRNFSSPPRDFLSPPPPTEKSRPDHLAFRQSTSSSTSRDLFFDADYSAGLPPSQASDTQPFLANERSRERGPNTPLPPYSTGAPGLSGSGPLSLDRFRSSFEEPPWKHMFLLCLAVAASFVLMFKVVEIAGRGLPLFWTRAIVGVFSTVNGLAIGYCLLEIGRRAFEAATWATIIHESVAGREGGLNLSQAFEVTRDPVAPMSAIVLLWRRLTHLRGAKRANRQAYDKRPWSMHILFFLVLVIVSMTISFALARIVNIDTFAVAQDDKFVQLPIVGDLSADDIARANIAFPAISDPNQQWTLNPLSANSALPSPISFASQFDNNQTVYFSDVWRAQLTPSGVGFGTFDVNNTLKRQVNASQWPVGDGNVGKGIRWPRWGIRVHCLTLPDPAANLLPLAPSGSTYTFIPIALLQSLYQFLNLDIPSALITPTILQGTLKPGDSLPSTLDPNTIALAGAFANTAAGFQIASVVVDDGSDGKGWQMIEMVLISLNNTFTPQGTFLASGPAAAGGSRIGFDVGICLEVWEPYVLEATNTTTGAPLTTGIIKKINTVSTSGGKDVGKPLTTVLEDLGLDGTAAADITINLNSTGKAGAFIAAHANSRNVLMDDSGRGIGSGFLVTPTVVSFTPGFGPDGYTQLTPGNLEHTLASADASNMLPFLVGSGRVLAHEYDDQNLAYPRVNAAVLAAYLGGILLLGILAGFLVPRLPLGMPRRDFALYSWVTAIDGGRLVNHENRETGAIHTAEIAELREKAGALKLRYGLTS